jgi:hypothetical protein
MRICRNPTADDGGFCTHNNHPELKECLVYPGFKQHFNDFRVVKVSIRQRDCRVYIDDSLIVQKMLDSTFTKIHSFNITSWSFNSTIDYVRIQDTAGNYIFNEEFNGCSNLAIPKTLCCEDKFARHFNANKGTDYSNVQIDSIYAAAGIPLDVCAPAADSLSNKLLCGNVVPVIVPDSIIDFVTNCTDSTFFIYSAATELHKVYTDSLMGEFESKYRNKCLEAYKYESFTVTHQTSEYHYTLYYYDQAGNLVKTIPPKGVNPNRSPSWIADVQANRAAKQSLVPSHTMATKYRYNTLNQVVAQITPDAGQSEFWYDRLGRLALSQNARQKAVSATAANSYTVIRSTMSSVG